MTPEQALQVLSDATQPHAQIDRKGYILIEQALSVLAKAIKPEPAPEPPTETQ